MAKPIFMPPFILKCVSLSDNEGSEEVWEVNDSKGRWVSCMMGKVPAIWLCNTLNIAAMQIHQDSVEILASLFYSAQNLVDCMRTKAEEEETDPSFDAQWGMLSYDLSRAEKLRPKSVKEVKA